ncbi:lipoprotein insertase outer membrane protein LolB [Hydrogenophaga sp. PAMC20947]|uniref:lipoprotein insertase outer membrane protein LolB n=1 Tax=Hydrogenophaga sp. PAMC20947 TaxID=2565558 RepID=UPI00109E0B1A|nr:lipoprotein insertase outer membrane protein LolB [Hydrogenophaga sp. PAMC20947]QCB46552.1 outer membrane lipoprotein LolB [Hydrogenophaga sp. PAMC20947]
MTSRPRTGRPGSGRRAVCGGLLLALLLAGCAAPRSAPVAGIASWNGRMALNVQSEPPQAYSAGFDLQGSAQSGELLLATPLGTTLATLQWAPGRAVLIQGDQTTERTSLEALSADLGGTALPVAALFAWLEGRPVKVMGWEADLSRHNEGRITARRSDPLPAAELRLVFQP